MRYVLSLIVILVLGIATSTPSNATFCRQVAGNSSLFGGNMRQVGRGMSEEQCIARCESLDARYCSMLTNGQCYAGQRFDKICNGHDCGCGSGRCYQARWDCTNRPQRARAQQRGSELCKLVARASVYSGGSIKPLGKASSLEQCERRCARAGVRYCSYWENGSCTGGNRVGKTCTGRQCGCGNGGCYAARWECGGGYRNIRARNAEPRRRGEGRGGRNEGRGGRGEARDLVEAHKFQLQDQGYRRVRLKEVRHTFNACRDGDRYVVTLNRDGNVVNRVLVGRCR